MHRRIKRLVLLGVFAAVAVGVLALTGGPAGAAGSSGTTLSATKTATGHFTRTFEWTIDKSVSPDQLDMFVGDSGTANYTVSVTKDDGTDNIWVDGEVCVTNGGDFPTQDLAIFDQVQQNLNDGNGYQDVSGASEQIDLGDHAILAPGEQQCYPYSISLTPTAGADYRNVAHVTITNHAGWVPGSHNCPGPDLCPFGPDPKADFSIPEPTLINNTINVDDTNGDSWEFSDDGSQQYSETYSCGESHTYDNTATIRETGQSDDASVDVNCYSLGVSKTAHTSFKRTYHWTIDKSADQSSLTLAEGQSFPVNYSVKVDVSGYTDSDWAVAGTITVTNPAPIDATVNDVTDVVSGGIDGTVDCGDLPATIDANGGTLECSYTADLPNADDRTNTATATLQNTPSGTTDFSSDPVDVSFADATRTDVDASVDVSDTLQGGLGSVSYDAAPATFGYQRSVGPYATCGKYNVDNTASFTTSDTGATGSDSWNVAIDVPCGGCTLTIGYWKNHAGFGPQADMVTALLPVWLGTANGTKSVKVTSAGQAVTLLSFSGDASNGINKLYAQLLAAKLNIASGASNASVAATIAAADAFLATKNSADWAGLTKAQKNSVLSWMTTLDNFNNGLIGPGHCSQ